MRPLRCDSRLLKFLPKFPESLLDVTFVSSCARLHGSPELSVLSPFPAYHVARVLQLFCGMNDSVCTQYLGVAFGEVEWAPLLGCFLTPECFDIDVIHGSIHFSSSWSVRLMLELATRNSASLSE